MLISVTVRPKPKKNISSVTTTPELEAALTVSDSSVTSALPGEKCNNYVQYSQLEPDEGPTTLRTKLCENNFMIQLSIQWSRNGGGGGGGGGGALAPPIIRLHVIVYIILYHADYYITLTPPLPIHLGLPNPKLVSTPLQSHD